MKKLLIIAALLLPMMVSAQKIGRINTSALLEIMPEVKEMSANLDSLNAQWENMLVSMQNEIKEKAAKYESDMAKGSMTDAQKQFYEEDLYNLQQRLQTTYQTAQADVQQKQEEWFKPIKEKISAAIKKVGKDKGYAYIMEEAAMLYYSETDTYDVFNDVKKELGLK